jgi:phage tail sheath protein FI
MPEYLSPGVYVEEIDRGPKPIEAVGTAMAVFVGFSEKAQLVEEVDDDVIATDLLNKPQLVTNWTQYVERFGAFVEGAYLPHAVYGYFLNGGARCYVVSVKTIPNAQAALLNDEGKPQLIAKAKRAGFDGLRLRVKIDVPKPAAPSRAKRGAKAKEGEEEEPTAEAPSPFTVTVERETPSGRWQVKETIRDISLQEEQEDGVKKVKVAYKEDRAPQWIDLLIPETRAPLAKLWPRAQEQSLSIEPGLLAPPATSDFQGEVAERTGVGGSSCPT